VRIAFMLAVGVFLLLPGGAFGASPRESIARVTHPVLAGNQQQTLSALARDLSGSPMSGATITATIQYGTTAVTYHLPRANASGESNITFRPPAGACPGHERAREDKPGPEQTAVPSQGREQVGRLTRTRSSAQDLDDRRVDPAGLFRPRRVEPGGWCAVSVRHVQPRRRGARLTETLLVETTVPARCTYRASGGLAVAGMKPMASGTPLDHCTFPRPGRAKPDRAGQRCAAWVPPARASDAPARRGAPGGRWSGGPSTG